MFCLSMFIFLACHLQRLFAFQSPKRQVEDPPPSFKAHRSPAKSPNQSRIVSVRWSREDAAPPAPSVAQQRKLSQSQLKAGRAIIKKYRRFARSYEYKRLHSLLPSISKRKYASKVKKKKPKVFFFFQKKFWETAT